MGDVHNFTNFMAAVIDKATFQNIKSYIDLPQVPVKLLFLWEAVAMTAWVTSVSCHRRDYQPQVQTDGGRDFRARPYHLCIR